MEQGQQKEDEPIEVSYTILRSVNQRSRSDIIQKVVAAINVQLTLENNQSIPLISPNDFDTVKHQDKLFISGPSGCGKSRCIYELFKDKLNNVENIYVINPRQTIGEESGRISIPKLTNKLNRKDIVIWDNFPDDLLKRDIESAQKVLEMISVKDVMNLLVALKPKYLEIYRGVTRKLPELYDYEITYDKEKIRSIITSYGENMIQFTDAYGKYILQNIHQISTILWQKEPLPITILAYYRELIRKHGTMQGESMDAVLEAEKLMHQTDYYKHQFAFISNLEDRQNDMDFLYTLKLCYESGLSRAPALIHQLQKGIFNSTPPKEPTRKLSTWIYLSGQYYSMHDAPGEAIEFSKDAKLKIINYLTANFSKVIPSEDNQIYSFGMFFGRNIDLVVHGTAYDFLPDHIYDYMKSKKYFEAGLGQGAGEIFPSLDYPVQDKIVRRIEIDGEFAKWLGYGLGSSFVSLDKERQVNILNTTIRKSIPFARGLGESLGYKFAEMSQELREEIIKVLLINENFQFARGLGMGLGLTFLQLDEQIKRKIFDFITKSYQFAIGIGYGLGNVFPSLPKDFQHEIFERADKDVQFAYGLGYQLGYNINLMNKELKKEVFTKIDKNSEFASGLSLGLGLSFTYLPKEFQEKLFRLTEENIQFAYGFSYGFGFIFNYLPEQLRLDLFARIERNSEFAKGLGYGLGYIFSVLDDDFQNDVFARMEENSEFAYGLGKGVGSIYEHMPSNLQEGIFKRAEKNSKFMRGLGDGLGYAFGLKNEKLQQDIFRLIERNSEFAIGLGIGLRYSFAYLSIQSQEEVKRRAKGNIQFAYGLGIGLGCMFVYLNDSLKNDLFEMAEKNRQFAIGLGEGFGHVFIYLKKELRNRILEDLDKESSDENDDTATGDTQDYKFRRNGDGFSRGLGIGLGKNFAYIRKKLGFRIFAKVSVNFQFAIGLGEGLGHIFSYLSDELQSKIIQKSNEYPLARGLGMGLGNVFYYLHNNEQLQNKIFEQINKNKIFANSLGESLSYNFSPLNDHELIQKILSTAYEKLDYDKSGFSFNDCPTIGLPNNTYYYCTNRENEITDQNIIDDEMKEYLQMVMDEMKNKIDNNKMNNLSGSKNRPIHPI
jgi:hypothetical protein